MYKYLQFKRIRTRLLNFCPASRGLRHNLLNLAYLDRFVELLPRFKGIATLTVNYAYMPVVMVELLPRFKGIATLGHISDFLFEVRVELLPRFKGIATWTAALVALAPPC